MQIKFPTFFFLLIQIPIKFLDFKFDYLNFLCHLTINFTHFKVFLSNLNFFDFLNLIICQIIIFLIFHNLIYQICHLIDCIFIIFDYCLLLLLIFNLIIINLISIIFSFLLNNIYFISFPSHFNYFIFYFLIIYFLMLLIILNPHLININLLIILFLYTITNYRLILKIFPLIHLYIFLISKLNHPLSITIFLVIIYSLNHASLLEIIQIMDNLVLFLINFDPNIHY